MSYRTSLNDYLTVERWVPGDLKPDGKYVMTWLPHLENICCRRVTMSGREVFNATSPDVETAHFYVEGGQDIQDADRILYHDRYYLITLSDMHHQGSKEVGFIVANATVVKKGED